MPTQYFDKTVVGCLDEKGIRLNGTRTLDLAWLWH